MRNWDWFNAIYLACLGFILGPVASFGLWYFTAVPNLFSPLDGLVAIILGAIAGPVLGLLWGLFGDWVKDRLYDVTAIIVRRRDKTD